MLKMMLVSSSNPRKVSKFFTWLLIVGTETFLWSSSWLTFCLILSITSEPILWLNQVKEPRDKAFWWRMTHKVRILILKISFSAPKDLKKSFCQLWTSSFFLTQLRLYTLWRRCHSALCLISNQNSKRHRLRRLIFWVLLVLLNPQMTTNLSRLILICRVSSELILRG